MSSPVLKVVSPVDGSVYAERPLAAAAEIEATLARAHSAQKIWRHVDLGERIRIAERFVSAMEEMKDEIVPELAWQMGRPIKYGAGEIRGLAERARHMAAIAIENLRDLDVGPKEGFRRFIRREPLGVVFVVAPWNYPFLTAVNAVVPAILAGNTVILKHSAQTPLVAERFLKAFGKAGMPQGVFQIKHLSHEDTDKVIRDPRISFVAFTGSVAGGHAVQQAASGRFIGTGLELGGKDPAYVRGDADLDHAIENLTDGAFFNSGQSCCGIERIYVHESVYDRFVDGVVALAKTYRLGDPLHAETTLGPMVRTAAANFVRRQVDEALAKGARSLVDGALFPAEQAGSPYLGPKVLVDVDHSMSIMAEETFGPAVGIMKVKSDEEAISLMNDSPYGLTAAIWTADVDAALKIGDQIETGTWFMNRCDYLDPALAWTGVKDSGRGCTLSSVGFEALTRPKSFHLRTRT